MESSCCILLCLLSFSYSLPFDLAENVTDVQEASVEEVPNPTMTIERADVTDYRPPGFYTFNNGEPFYLEKDPVTGTIDFNKKTFSVTTGYSSTPAEYTPKLDRITEEDATNSTDSDYYEDDEPDEIGTIGQDFKEDEIDRKDGNINSDIPYRPNDIFKNNPYKISPDLHQFLNLPVHYSTNDKFPLISSSYANTKIQGTGSSSSSGYSNHKYGTTSTTQSPSYYTLRHMSTTTPKPMTTPSTTRKPISTPPTPSTTLYSTSSTTTTPIISSTTTSTTTNGPFSIKTPSTDYTDGEDLVYSDYDMEYEQHNTHPNRLPSTVTPVKIPTTTHKFKQTSTRRPTIVYTVTEDEAEDNISIVTSLPVDAYYYTRDTPTSTTTTSTSTTTTSTPRTTTTEKVKEETTLPVKTTAISTKLTSGSAKPTIGSTKPTIGFTKQPEKTTTKYTTALKEEYKPVHNNYYGVKETFTPVVDEPFRPIFGPMDISPHPSSTQKPTLYVTNNIKTTTIKPYIEYHAPSQAKPLPSGNQGKIEFVDRVPSGDHSQIYPPKPVSPSKYHTVESPDPHPPLLYSNTGSANYQQEHVIKPGQVSVSTHSTNEKLNIDGKPLHETTHYGRPQPNGGPLHSSLLHGNPSLPHSEQPSRIPPQKQRPPFVRLPDDSQPPYPFKKHTNSSVVKVPRPEEPIHSHQRPSGSISPALTKPTVHQVVKFHPPMKQDNHYIKVPMDQENPSYSLQTSFSIGLPGDHAGNKEKEPLRPGQGIGQVLFPDDTPDHNLQPDNDKNVQSTPIKNRPPQNPRPYITTTYSQNSNPQPRPQPPPILPHRPQRLPIPDLRPPKPGGESYPRPHWETHGKPQIPFNSQHNKQEIAVSAYPAVNRIKTEPLHSQRHDLPNILPQFRPNAKVGANEYPLNLGAQSERLREPMDTLQPPPLPQPQHLRVNRNDDDLGLVLGEELEKTVEENDSTQVPLVHRRTGPQPSSRVTTLQMMQQSPPRKNLVRTDFHDHRKDRPVFLVYPSNAGPKPGPSNEGVVVVGTRGPQQPLPPSNLDAPEDDLDPFPLDDSKHFSLPTRDRVDTPILKTKTPAKPLIKNDFPYEILKPQENVLPEERILAGSVVTKEYNAFSPTISSSTEDIKDHDAEINLIPYLQDYMPFATKKPSTLKPIPNIPVQLLTPEKKVDVSKSSLSSTVKPISVTLNTKLGTTTVKPEKPVELVKYTKPSLLPAPSRHESVIDSSGNSEFTVGAMMNYQKKTVNHRPVEISSQIASTQPKPLDLEAPFQASLSAPQSQGWTVVKNSEKTNHEVDRYDNEHENTEKKPAISETKFDFDNFKPQLFGGFKPIIPQGTPEKPTAGESSPKESSAEEKSLIPERQEKRYY